MSKNDRLHNYQAKQELIAKRAKIRAGDNRKGLLIAAAALVIAFAGQQVYFNFGPGYVEEVATAEPTASETPNVEETTPTNSAEVPSPELAENRIWSGSMDLSGDAISFDLDGVAAPQAVANFVSLASEGYFEGLSCHRLTTAGIYVLQCGDPNGDGTGGPGYNFGPIENAPADDLYPAGTIAMARRGGDDFSMGSQFFIVYQDSAIPSDSVGGYTMFGTLTSGLEAVQAIAAAGTADGGTDGSPAEPVTLENVSVE